MIDGDKYGSFVDGIFSKSNYSNPGEYDLRLFDNINNMIDDLNVDISLIIEKNLGAKDFFSM